METKRTPVIQLHGHKVNPANDKVTIEVVDQPGSGGAHHAYLVHGMDLLRTNPSYHLLAEHAEQLANFEGKDSYFVLFQNGPIPEAGVNGVTHEVLLEILIHRLQGFQAGQFGCRENALALTHLQEAQMWLQKRTRDRMARNVEGTHQV